MKSRDGVTFIAQIQKLETRKDGSCRLTIEAGSEAIEEIHWIQKLAVKRDQSFQVAFVPEPNKVYGQRHADIQSSHEGTEPEE